MSCVPAVLLSLLLAATTAAVWADALDGVLEVRSAYVNIDKGVFLLHARVEYPVNPGHPRRLARWRHTDI